MGLCDLCGRNPADGNVCYQYLREAVYQNGFNPYELNVMDSRIEWEGDSEDNFDFWKLKTAERTKDWSICPTCKEQLDPYLEDVAVQLVLTLETEDPKERLKRAADVARTSDPQIDQLLREGLADKGPALRAGCALALGGRGDVKSVGPLLKTLAKDESTDVRAAAATALGLLGGPDAVAGLIARLRDASGMVRRDVAAALGETRDPSAVEPLAHRLKDTDQAVRLATTKALTVIRDPRAVPAMILRLQDKSEAVRLAAANALGEFSSREAVLPLIAVIKGNDVAVRPAAVIALGRLKDPRAVAPLGELLRKERDRGLRQAIVGALGSLTYPETAVLLQSVLETEQDPALRQAAESILARMGGAPAKKKGPCFVATAAMGSADHGCVTTLQDFRDTVLVCVRVGRAFVRLYNACGPFLARAIACRPAARALCRVLIVRPAAWVAGRIVRRPR